MTYRITGLEPSHATDCRESSLEQYLRQYARQDIRRRVSRVFVATVADNPTAIAGYYTLSAGSVKCSERPIHLGKKLPRYPIPVALLGRLAVTADCHGQGLGAILLADACRRVHQASNRLGVYAVLADALNDQAKAFYLHHGFIALPNQRTRLLLPLTTMAQAMP